MECYNKADPTSGEYSQQDITSISHILRGVNEYLYYGTVHLCMVHMDTTHSQCHSETISIYVRTYVGTGFDIDSFFQTYGTVPYGMVP